MAKKHISCSKFPAMITYIVAVLSLIVGLVLPLGSKALAEGGIQLDNMPILQIGGALVALGLLGDLPFGSALTPLFSFETSVLGTTVNLGAILLIAYAAVTVLALILLIPVCVAKRNRPFARRLAMFAEIVALTVLLAFAVIELQKNSGDWNLSVFIPLGITLLMLIVQSIIYFKGSGVIKTVTLILSALALLVAIFNVVAIIPALSDPIGNIMENMQGKRPFETVLGLYSIGGITYFGNMLIFGLIPLIPAATPELGIVNIIALALCILVCLNLLLNMFGLGKRTKGSMLKFNLIRYIAEFVLIIVLSGAVFWLMGNLGLSLIVLTVISLCQLIIAIARRASYRKERVYVWEVRKSDVAKADIAEVNGHSAAPDTETDHVETDQTVASETAVTTVAPAVAEPEVAAEAEYSGPTDTFIQKLTNPQKIEFAKIFLEEGSSNISGIPKYEVGGDNSKFFSSIFIFLARVRDIVSDGLMNKFYEEVNLI